ncbi:HEPN domain-containing protein [Myceligenerans crystallogenes]|uniref:HEPN domain-containing protein n=1 Tax=Myceligenerans crystallogenes TaxID=316335 RepID=A0ABN2N1B1_9MICO
MPEIADPTRPPEDLNWRPDAPAKEFLLGRGQIEQVEPHSEHARTLLAEARRHLSSASLLATTDDQSAAFVTAYDAARKALAAVLAVQGLRARGGDGGHRVLGELVQAQIPDRRRTLREFDWMRQKRNDTEYPDFERPTAARRDVDDGILAARAIVDLAEQFVEAVAGPAGRAGTS